MSRPHDNGGPGDYLRPDARWVCGRAAAWGKPCPHGPDHGGRCGGTGECAPERGADGRWRCARPACDGGPCDLGPDAAGRCAQSLPACVPRPSLRRRRGRVAAASAALVALLLVALVWNPLDPARHGPGLDPGPLSPAHAQFVGADNCAACHGEREMSAAGFARALFQRHDFAGHCVQCHQFGGPARAPHNEPWAVTRGNASPDCNACHMEHHGDGTLLTRHTDAQCHSCHKQPFERFDAGHPPFPAAYPEARAGLRFSHATHLGQHFSRAEQARLAPADCTGCHRASADDAALAPVSYATACAACHERQIVENDLPVLRLTDPVASSEDGTVAAADNTRLMAWLLQGGGGETFGGRWRALLADAAENGPAALEKLAGGADAATLVAGLGGDPLRAAAKQWLAGTQFAPGGGAATSGWWWMEDLYPELRYRPMAHADPVLRAWIGRAWGVAPGDSPAGAALKDLRGEMLDAANGPGRCAKCHELPPADSAAARVDWKPAPAAAAPHTRFSHGAHLGLLSCNGCHRLETASPGARAPSDFHPVTVLNCTDCHAAGKVRNDCRTCHSYHNAHALRDSWRDQASSVTGVLGTAMQARQDPASTVTPGSRR